MDSVVRGRVFNSNGQNSNREKWEMKLYRVIVRKTSSVQPHGTFWNRTVLYCGYDRDEARQTYHESEVSDSWRNYGNPARETYLEVITDAETDDFGEDIAETIPTPRKC